MEVFDLQKKRSLDHCVAFGSKVTKILGFADHGLLMTINGGTIPVAPIPIPVPLTAARFRFRPKNYTLIPIPANNLLVDSDSIPTVQERNSRNSFQCPKMTVNLLTQIYTRFVPNWVYIWGRRLTAAFLVLETVSTISFPDCWNWIRIDQ